MYAPDYLSFTDLLSGSTVSWHEYASSWLDSLTVLCWSFLASRHLANPRHTEQLTGVTMSVLDIYGDVVPSSPEAIGLLTKLHAQVANGFAAEEAALNVVTVG